MIAASADLLTERDLFCIAAKVGVECDRDKVFGDVLRFDLGAGEPPGTIGSARASGAPEGTTIGRSEDQQRLSFLRGLFTSGA